MSILFGIRKAEPEMIGERQLLDLAGSTIRYAPDGTFVQASGRIGMGFQPYATHQRSRLESQPAVDARGNMLTLDGRIDNHKELAMLLGGQKCDVADTILILAAFEQWGEGCFSRLIGDWALALWSRADRSLYLARDHAGTRTLFFERTEERLLWSTHLETFFAEGRSHAIDETFAARYLACEPIRDLTPYRGITAIPPAQYLVFTEDKTLRKRHWEPTVTDKIEYATDAEYEEHFLTLFRQSVERRTGPGSPILAQLSGGMDSTSIVCVSDNLRKAHSATPKELIDTVSYYDDTDPDWDEKPYFSCVERGRRKTGLHLPFPLLNETLQPAPVAYFWPSADRSTFENEVRLERVSRSRGYRVILSGIGGDELLGGVPTPLPELADLLASGQLGIFAKRTLAWCLVDRTPFLHMTGSAIEFLLQQYSILSPTKATPPLWATLKLRRLLSPMHRGIEERHPSFSVAPSGISNGRAWWETIETLPHLIPGFLSRYEYRYPYLDRDLVEFLLRVPRERLLQPGRRRSMMRRALRDIVPVEVLERRRKAFRSRSVLGPLRNNISRLAALLECSRAAEIGLVEPKNLIEITGRAVQESNQQWIRYITRLILFELWHRSTESHLSDVSSAVCT
jgi:asparagine synthase (glutamine-hydrolysing)